MKKYSFWFIMLEIAIMLVISAIPAVAVAILTGSNLWILALIVMLEVVLIIYLNGSPKWLFKLAKKTMDKHLEEEGFVSTRTFYNKEATSCPSILVIDETHSKIAYVSGYNPTKIQTADAKDLTDVKSSYIEGPFGGTRYVYYQFRYKNKRTRIPTFTSRRMHFTSATIVQNAILKANRFRDSITMLQQRES